MTLAPLEVPLGERGGGFQRTCMTPGDVPQCTWTSCGGNGGPGEERSKRRHADWLCCSLTDIIAKKCTRMEITVFVLFPSHRLKLWFCLLVGPPVLKAFFLLYRFYRIIIKKRSIIMLQFSVRSSIFRAYSAVRAVL